MMELAVPFLTADLAGTGGVIKKYDEDFVVEEVSQYHAKGRGTHVYFQIEKRGLTTLRANREIARALRKKPSDVGYAGLKDAHGVTRQWLSVEHVDVEHVRSLAIDRIKVLEVTKHTNKLKLGHLSGNKFVVRVRDACGDGLERARAIVDVLSGRGLPNYFGPQRFGVRGDNAVIGRAILRDDYDKAIQVMLGRANEFDNDAIRKARDLFDARDYEAAARAWPGRSFTEQATVCVTYGRTGRDAKKAWRVVNHTLRKLYLSSFQSELFNRIVADRIDSIDKLEPGDVAWKHANGACFLVEDAEVEQPRCDSFEISPTGPIFGRKMKRPTGQPDETEQAVLLESGLTVDSIDSKGSGKLDGARRPMRVPLRDAAVSAGRDERGEYLELSFFLPPGSYATNALREVTKT